MTMHPILKFWAPLAAVLLSSVAAQPIANERYTLAPAADGAVQLTA